MRSRRINAAEAWSLTAQGIDQIFDLAHQVVRVLAERDPQDAVIISLLDVLVIAESLCHRRFAIAASATQRGRNRNWLLATMIQQFVDQRIKFLWARHIVPWQVFDNEGHACSNR